MRTFTTYLITTLAAALFSVSALSASELEVRFDKAQYDEVKQELYVNVQLRNRSQADLSLAGQNYRFYYDSEVLTLDTEASASALTGRKYTELSLEDHKSGIQADQVNQVTFDDNLGFVNFSIDLHDLKDGGEILSTDEWTTVARLKFEVKQEDVGYDLVWGRRGATDLYATAFVELQEWKSSTTLEKVEITYYGDLSSEESSREVAIFEAAIGPNPTSDYVNITLENTLDADATVIIRDVTGKQVKLQTISRGDISTQIDLTDVAPTTYLLELINNESTVLNQTRIIVAR